MLLILSLFGWATVKLKCNISTESIEVSIFSVVGIKKYCFLARLEGMDKNSFFEDAINDKAIKSPDDAHYHKYVSSNGITLKTKYYQNLLLKSC